MAAVIAEKGLSPDELNLLQMARELGVTGMLLDELRKRQEQQEHQRAYERALALATKMWEMGKEEGVVEVQVVVKYGDGKTTTARYPSPHPRSRNTGAVKTKTKGNYPPELIEELKEESAKRGVAWFGPANALRTTWGAEIAKKYE